MSTTHESTNVEIPDDISELDGPSERYHPILEVWQQVLKPIETERFKRITPQWANRIVSSYADMTFRDMAAYRDHYYVRLRELRDILQEEIDTDGECLNVTSVEEDRVENRFHYINVLSDWQTRFLLWEMAWNPSNEDAAIDLVAMAEIHRMFFDEKGLVSILDQIDMEFTDDDRQHLADALAETRDAYEATEIHDA